MESENIETLFGSPAQTEQEAMIAQQEEITDDLLGNINYLIAELSELALLIDKHDTLSLMPGLEKLFAEYLPHMLSHVGENSGSYRKPNETTVALMLAYCIRSLLTVPTLSEAVNYLTTAELEHFYQASVFASKLNRYNNHLDNIFAEE